MDGDIICINKLCRGTLFFIWRNGFLIEARIYNF